MSLRATDPLLLAGRVLTIIMQAMMAIAAAILAITLPALLIFRSEIIVELVAEHGPAASDPPVLAISALLVVICLVLLAFFRFFGNLRRIIETVGEGDPFVPENADRLTQMAWLMTGSYLLIGIAAAIAVTVVEWAKTLGETDGSMALSFDLSAILSIIVLFILARVFRKGTEMREDLEGTV